MGQPPSSKVKNNPAIYIFGRKIVNIFLPISFNICLGAQKNHLIETVLLSTHNI